MKNVFALYNESTWNDREEYNDVLAVFNDKESAKKELAKLREEFLDENKEDIEEIKDVSYIDTPTHFQCLDEGMGYYYELIIMERPFFS